MNGWNIYINGSEQFTDREAALDAIGRALDALQPFQVQISIYPAEPVDVPAWKKGNNARLRERR